MNQYNNPQDYADSMEITAKKILKIAGFVILGIIIVLAFSFGIKLLWNWLIPTIFGLREITYFEGIGLLVLAKMFFGGFGGGDSSSGRKKEEGFKHEVKGQVSKAIHDEMQQEFKKEFHDKFGDGHNLNHSDLTASESMSSMTPTNESAETPAKTDAFDTTEALSNSDQDDLYDKWWDSEGEKLFESYLSNQ